MSHGPPQWINLPHLYPDPVIYLGQNGSDLTHSILTEKGLQRVSYEQVSPDPNTLPVFPMEVPLNLRDKNRRLQEKVEALERDNEQLRQRNEELYERVNILLTPAYQLQQPRKVTT